MRQIIMNLGSSDSYLFYGEHLRQGENLSAELIVNLNEEFQGYRYLLVFQLNENEAVYTEELFPIENRLTYPIPKELLTEPGTLKVELQAFEEITPDNIKIIKSAITKLKVAESLEGVVEIMPEPYVPWYTLAVEASTTAAEQANIATQKAEEVENIRDSIVTEEEARQAAEAIRIQAENDRLTNESDRVAAENARVNAENIRVAAEDGRIANEADRQNNEAARVAAEQGRVEAESLREQTIARLDGRFKEHELKITTIEKDVDEYRKVMSQVNINQEAKQTATGYGIVSLPRNAANGQVGVSVKGNTYTQILEIDQNDWRNSFIAFGNSEITQNSAIIRGAFSHRIELSNPIEYREGKKYGLLIKAHGVGVIWYRGTNVGYRIEDGYIKTTFNYDELDSNNIENKRFWRTSGTDDITITKLIIIELDTQSEWDFNNLSPEELDKKYTYIDGTKSTVSASRLKSVGKNLWNYTDLSHPENEESYGWGLLLTDGKFTIGEKYTISANQTFWCKISTHPSGINTFQGTGYDSYTFTYTNSMNGLYLMANRKNLTTIINMDELKSYNIQLEKGDTATPYEPYTESKMYVTAYDENGDIIELRSLPNGTKDEINLAQGKVIIRTKEKALQATDINRITSSTNVDYVWIKKPNDFAFHGSVAEAGDSAFILEGYTNFSGGEYDDANKVGQVSSSAQSINFYLITAKGAYATLQEAQTALAGLQLIYQLAEPVEIPVQVSGTLLSYPSGTVYVENVVADAGIYSDKMTVLHQDLPIDYIERLFKVDFVTGLETELDVSQCVVAADKLSFTHPNLVDGDIVFFTYFYERESTEGEFTGEYYDSRYTIKDTANDKFYQWKISSTNGTPSIELVEV